MVKAMRKWMATVTVDQERLDMKRVREYVAALDDYSGVVGVAPGGGLSGNSQATLTVVAATLGEACVLACQVVADVLEAEAIACDVLTSAAARLEMGVHRELAEVEVGDLLSVSEVAELLGVSRQAVLGRISSGTLPAERVGRDWAISRAAVKPGRPGRPRAT